MTLPAPTDPRCLAICLDWYHDTLPHPRAPRGWQQGGSGFTRPTAAKTWRECEQCNGQGTTRRGPCPNCEGAGGWHYDPMDERRAALRTSADAHPERDAPMRYRTVRLSSDTTRERLTEDGLWDEQPRPLQQLIEGLDALREANRYHRFLLQRTHIIRVGYLRDAEREQYAAALDHLGALMPPKFRPPRWVREKAAASHTDPPRTNAGLH